MKSNAENIFYINMHCDVHWGPTKFEIKIQFVHGETTDKLYYG